MIRAVKNSQGFTLIELVVVIIILGVLAATAAPKFINLQADAQTSTLQAVKGALESASAMIYSKSIIAGNQGQPESANPPPTITLPDGTVLTVHYGYPKEDPNDWQALLDLDSDFSFVSDPNGGMVIYLTGVTPAPDSSADCIVVYNQATSTSRYLVNINKCI